MQGAVAVQAHQVDYQDVAACYYAVAEWCDVAAEIDFHAVVDCHDEEAEIDSAGMEAENLRRMAEVGRCENEEGLEMGRSEREPMDHSENEVADLERFGSEAEGLGIGEGHLGIGVGSHAGQKVEVAGAQRRVDYWDTGAYLGDQSLVAAAGKEAVAVVVGTETAAVAAEMGTAEDPYAGHMAGVV